jgi:hypothetical protein
MSLRGELSGDVFIEPLISSLEPQAL